MEIRSDKFKNTSDFEGRTGSATLNMEKLSLFMDSMISNYNYPELAVLREWVSNAHDAHVASGVEAPVKVTLPSKLSPMLVVQDFGAGMSADFVENFYLSFGSSSKDKSNDEIGGFGQGGKSALAIASQYTMVTISQGLKSIYIFERSPIGGVDYKNPIYEVPTDEPSGVTVQVAVDRYDQYTEANINRVLSGWSNSAIELSTGKKFFSIPDSGTLVSFEVDCTDHSKVDEPDFEEDIRNARGYVLNSAFDITNSSKKLRKELDLKHGEYVVLVGPVAYVFSPEFVSHRVLADHMVASVNIGHVSFPSSREVIEPTRDNRTFVAKCFEKIVEEADKLLQERANNLSDRRTALTLHRSPLAQTTRDLKITFKDEVIPQTFMSRADESVFRYELTGAYYSAKSYKLVEQVIGGIEKERKLEVETLVILDDDSSLQSVRNNVRIRHTELGHKPESLSGYLVVSKKPDSWVKAAANAVMKSSELAELARDYRKKKRDAAAAAKAAGLPAPAAPVRKTKAERIGEYSADWLVFGKDSEGSFRVTSNGSDLMDFYTNHFDPKKTLVLSTRDSEYHPSNFTGHFTNFRVDPSDAQFLSVGTGSKIETLRILLGEDVKIMALDKWMKENFSKLAQFNGRKPREIARELPIDMSNSVLNLLADLGEDTVHPKYLEFKALQSELDEAENLVGRGYFGDYSARLVRSVLSDFNSRTQISERPEFFFLGQLGYYASLKNEEDRAAIRHSMNQMVENWLDNLALEEAEAEEAEAEATKAAEVDSSKAPEALSLTN